MKKTMVCLIAVILGLPVFARGAADLSADGKTATVTRDELKDRIHGAWVGMLVGGLEGLAHEFRYGDKPRDTLPDFKMLPKGARTDDDNDFEWTHLYYMDKDGVLKIPYEKIVEIWKANMNKGIYVANKRARELMDQGVVPPETGDPKKNPAAKFNLSGQFCVESYGMIAPGMPRAAADIGAHYARIAVSGEPIQATQYWTSLISLNAFRTNSMEDLLKTTQAAVDPASAISEVVQDAIKAFHDNPEDWKAARQAMYTKWCKERKWNNNSTPANGAMVLLALLYGQDDFYKTMQYAMAMGLDADCNAATAGAVVGMRLGFARISALPDFHMADVFRNGTRPELPKEVKVSEQAEMMMRVCERVILENGGKKVEVNGKPGFQIPLQEPQPPQPDKKQ